MDDLGDRMKLYEGAEANRRLMPLLPILARIDGRCFSSFTRDMERPYHHGLWALMHRTATHMAQETNALVAYTQSDEITLALYSDNFKSQVFFDGRVQKLASVLASMTTVFFNRKLPDYLDASRYASRMPHFDCRVWNVPSLEEAANVFLWRELDATRNSVESAARVHFSHKQLHGKSGAEMQEMMFQEGVNWNDYPSFFKRGSYIQRRIVRRKYTPNELELLPERHDARKNPDLEIERSEWRGVELPPLRTVRNRVGVLFFGEEPRYTVDGANRPT